MNRLNFPLAIIGIGLVLLVLNRESGQTFGIDNDRFGRMTYLLPILAMLSAGILAGRRGNLATVLRQLAIWLVLLFGFVCLYLYRDDLRPFGERLLAGLMPGRAVVVTSHDGRQDVVLHKSMSGHFEIEATIDGVAVPMLVDTGASSVVLSARDAAAAGIDPADLAYTIAVTTANGRTFAAPVRLSQIAVGPIVRRNVPALVAREGQLDRSLLGMSFLSTLGSLSFRADELRLRDR